ncbi:cupin domain-containing protein [Dankookia sp. GCM10030260]|uniref:cupin domain-containing protein n=1 Tax=Dankookia sp. GCM10030260 TaxID=3273390 RepID=UPI00360A77D3
MKNIKRRSTFAVGVAAITPALVASQTAAAQTRSPPAEGREILPGVRQVDYGERPSKIEGFKTVKMRDLVMQPGSEIPDHPMDNAMVCHITEGELTIRQDGKEFVAKKGTIWDCGKGTREAGKNNGSVVAIMRVTDLLA